MLRRGYLKNKRELEPTHDSRNLRKILFTDLHDHFIEHKMLFPEIFAAHTLSLCNLTQVTHEVICSTNFQIPSFKRKILHQGFAACLPKTLHDHIHLVPEVKKKISYNMAFKGIVF